MAIAGKKTFVSYVAHPGRADGRIQVQAEVEWTGEDPIGVLGSEAAKFGPEERDAAIYWLAERGCDRYNAENLVDMAFGGKFRATVRNGSSDLNAERA
jgi:hypothetical protein